MCNSTGRTMTLLVRGEGMTDPVAGIGGSTVVSRGEGKGGGNNPGKRQKREFVAREDQVDISEAARKIHKTPAKGLWQSILEWLGMAGGGR